MTTTENEFKIAPEKTGLSVLDDAVKAVDENRKKPVPKEGRRVPGDGKCIRCGEKKPINRLKLCYKCFVIVNIIKIERERFGRFWKEGMRHPDWCQCTLPEHVRSSSGN